MFANHPGADGPPDLRPRRARKQPLRRDYPDLSFRFVVPDPWPSDRAVYGDTRGDVASWPAWTDRPLPLGTGPDPEPAPAPDERTEL